MDIETIRWLAGAIIAPALAWCLWVHIKLMAVHRDTKEMVVMLKNADAYGFGTKKTNEIIEANTKVMKELVYYIQYLGKKETGEPLPPFIDMS